MAMMRDSRKESFYWIVLALLLMAFTVDMQIVSNTTVTAVSCASIHGEAFGNESVKPGVCYLVSEEEGVFLDARAFCQGLNDSLGWDVADIEDAEENNLIQSLLTALKDSGSFSNATVFWIGQNDISTEDVWIYLNDSSNKCNRTAYLNWEEYNSTQPDGGRRENCVAYFYDAGGNFQDRRCDGIYNYLCKVKITSDTIPSCNDTNEDTNVMEAPDECVDIELFAFSNPSMPGVCYASNSFETVSFQEALSYCESLSGGIWSVADIENVEENLFLEAWNRDNFPKNDGYWIGQNDREQEGDYRYTYSGQCPVYLNWDINQPNGIRGQNCMVILKKETGHFHDRDCSEGLYYALCKLKTNPGPTQDPLASCDGSTLPPEVTACWSLHDNAFGSLDYPGLCYVMTGLELTWGAAVEYCREQGWTLIDIENATEHDILAARHRDFGPFDLNYWIGQNDRGSEGTWKYSSSNTLSDEPVYVNWTSGQMNDSDHSENCVMMDRSGHWHDRPCSDTYYVTCKKGIDEVTTNCTDHAPNKRSGQFVMLALNVTCHTNSVLANNSHADSAFQCAGNCLHNDACFGFSFAPSGEEDACVLCKESPDVKDLAFKSGSVYYKLW